MARLTAAGADVAGWARGETLARLSAGEALRLESYQGDWSGPVRVVPEPVSVPLVFVTCKSSDTPAVAAALPRGSTVVSAQNGIDNLEAIERYHDDAVAAVVYSQCRRVDPVTVRHTGNGFLVLGDVRVVEWLSAYGIDARLERDVVRAQWQKLMANAVVNALCMITQTEVGAVILDGRLRGVIRAALEEVAAVARGAGVSIGDDEVRHLHENVIDRLGHDSRPSSLQDLEAGRPTELEALTGAVLRRAELHGVSVPVLCTLHALAGLRERLGPVAAG